MSDQQSNSSEGLERILNDFEEDLKLVPTYNTLERQKVSRALIYDLAMKAIEARYLPRKQVEAALIHEDPKTAPYEYLHTETRNTLRDEISNALGLDNRKNRL